MRELIAFIFLVVLIIAGWNQSYRSHLESIGGDPVRVTPEPVTTPGADSATPRAATPPVAAPAGQDRQWMFEKKPGEVSLTPAGTPGGRNGP